MQWNKADRQASSRPSPRMWDSDRWKERQSRVHHENFMHIRRRPFSIHSVPTPVPSQAVLRNDDKQKSRSNTRIRRHRFDGWSLFAWPAVRRLFKNNILGLRQSVCESGKRKLDQKRGMERSVKLNPLFFSICCYCLWFVVVILYVW